MNYAHPPHLPGYQLLSPLSAGGMGEVWLARRQGALGFEKLLAVKLMRPELDQHVETRVMFLDEARLVARIDHPSVAHVYDFGEAESSLYLAMEYVPGVALNRLIVQQLGPLPPKVAARIIAKALRGLHAAHELCDVEGHPLGVVHRDVSPGNVMLTFDGRVKMLDFGIATMRDRESPDTQMGAIKGKPSYMSPEQMRGEPVDRRSDVYSASVVLHEMLTGRKLFGRPNVVATVLAVERGDAPSPDEVVEGLPKDLAAAVMIGLENAPEARFPTAQAMADALDDIARRLVGPSLEAFAEDELAEARELHQEWLRQVTTGTFRAHREESSQEPSSRSRLPARRALETPPTPLPQIAAWFLIVVVLGFLGFMSYRSAQSTVVAATPLEAASPPSALSVERTVSVLEPDVSVPAVAEPTRIATTKKSRSRPTKRRSKRSRKKTLAEVVPVPSSETVVEAPGERSPKVGTGFVTIGARPYALVRIDGRAIGVTPIVRRPLPAGEHEVQLSSPETGEVRWRQRVRIAAGLHRRITLN